MVDSNTYNLNSLMIDWLFDQSFFGIILLDEDLNILSINNWLLEKKNLNKNEIEFKNILDIFPEIKERKLDKYLYDALSGIHNILSPKFHKYFIRIPLKQNYEVGYEHHRTEISPLVADGKIYGIIIRIEDVTERVVHELMLQNTIKRLEKSNYLANLNIAKFRSLAENLPDIIFRFNYNLNLEYVNSKITSISNQFPEELINKNISNLALPSQFITPFGDALLTVIETKVTKEVKFRCHINGKDLIYIATFIPEFNPDNMLDSILVVCRDISDEEQAKNELKKYNTELKKLNVSKDKLFSIIAHDLKSPFNYLLNAVEVLEEEYENLSYQEIKKFLNEFKSLTKNIYGMLENLLIWAQLQRNTITPNISNFNLMDLVENILLIQKKIAESKDISLKNNIKPYLYIDGDPDLLIIVIRNLISNAIKFTPRGGEIIISSNCTDSFIEIEFKDTGIGIPYDRIQSLFQIDKVKSEKGTEGEKGSGLGLSLVKDIIEIHKGLIKVESEVGKGTSFKIILPKASPK